MKYNFFLTSVLVVAGLVQPAVAETFPADGYMQEDKTYENAATYTNTGVYDGSVTATAEYTDNIYNIAAGTYLPAGAEVAETCTAGSFCPGKTDATYDEAAPQGITVCPDGYPNSAAGASADTQCYTACKDIAHATSVSGNDYYGTGTDTCAVTCEVGYHLNEEIRFVDKTPIIPVDYTLPGDGYAYVYADGSRSNSNFADAGLTEPNTWAAHFGYGTVYGRASCQSEIANLGRLYLLRNKQAVRDGQMTYEDFESGLAAIVGTAKAAYISDSLRDYDAAINTANKEPGIVFDKIEYVMLGSEPNSNYSTDSEGQYCYCQTTSYSPTGGSVVEAASAPWVFYTNAGKAANCASNCAYNCARAAQFGAIYHGFRAAMFGALGVEDSATCDANEITINWSDADQADIDANNAGICTYGEDIRTPVKAVTKKGKTFKGWKFEKAN